MITNLEMWNFMSVEHAVMAFGEGLTALKGPNEAGKSTRYLAIAYALFGARSLPLSLAETVTWGKPESQLKVSLAFTHAGNRYTIERSKSGATLLCNAQNLIVSGAAEVTRFIEQLFSVNADMAGKLVIASQNALRGALEDNSAVQMIETLANINLIDELISKTQEQLPCGSTKVLEASLSEALEVAPPVADHTLLEEAEAQALVTLTANKEVLAALQAVTAGFEEQAQKAEVVLREAAVHEHRIIDSRKKQAALQATLSNPIPVFVDNIEDLERAIAAQDQLKVAAEAFKVFSAFTPKEVRAYEGTDILAAIKDASTKVTEAIAKKSQMQSDLRVHLLGRIANDTCATCKRPFHNHEEIAKTNAEIESKALQMSAAIEVQTAELGLLNNTLHALDQTLAEQEARDRVLLQTGSFVVADRSTYPMGLSWGGAPVLSDATDYRGQLKLARAAKTAHEVATAAAQTAKTELEAVEDWLRTHGQSLPTQEAEDWKTALATHRQALADAQQKVNSAQSAHSVALSLLGQAQAQYKAEQAQYEAVQAQIAKLRSTIQVYDGNNELIKRLREARPIVAAKLWAVVQTSVSHYFSEIRGTPSAVTVRKSTFLIDNKPAKAYSGSTIDSLGLAIRMALAKTFLPSLDFLLLDEPAAGMDDTREAAMLATLASANFRQVVVVTHSTVADAFAAQVIQI